MVDHPSLLKLGQRWEGVLYPSSHGFDSENVKMALEGIMSLLSPWSFSRINHLDRVICI